MFKKMLVAVALATLAAAPMSVRASPFDGREAVEALTSGRVFFDVNLANRAAMPLYLSVIEMTRQTLVERGLKPEIVVAFRGPAALIPTVTTEAATAEWIAALAANGVKFEVCAIAMQVFGAQAADILPEVEIVGNTFISSMSYQARRYATIPIQ